jgi:hypothetical protein
MAKDRAKDAKDDDLLKDLSPMDQELVRDILRDHLQLSVEFKFRHS